MNVAAQVAYWRAGSDEDIAAAESLIEKGHPRHALFFAHLAVEKLLKAHVCRVTQDVAPRVHDLFRLAELAGLRLWPERAVLLARFQKYCLEGRYPDPGPLATAEEGQRGLAEAREMRAWLMSLLP